ncbi:MAG: thiamine diphosphokinase [Candidatus Cryptobacteroides sp.]
MSQAVIIGNGTFPAKEYPRQLLRQADLIVCCDGGFRSFLRNRKAIWGDSGKLPDVVIGDMDSLSGKLRNEYSDLIVEVASQDDNDQTKAVRHIAENHPEVDTIHILGATGKRECHTIGNLSLLMEYARTFGMGGDPQEGGIFMDMVSDYSTAFAITSSCELWVGQGRNVSIFSPDNSLRIRSEGLVWPTDDVRFDNWWKATLNRASSDSIRLTFSHESMALVILD